MANSTARVVVEHDRSINKVKNLRLSGREFPSEDMPAVFAYRILHVAFTVAPIIAGLDKFFNILTDWTQYLAPIVPRITGLNPQIFMGIVGIIEVIAGVGVLLKPKIFGYVVFAWLIGIIVNLLILGNFYDVALRDLGLCLSALAFAQLSTTYEMRRKHAES